MVRGMRVSQLILSGPSVSTMNSVIFAFISSLQFEEKVKEKFSPIILFYVLYFTISWRKCTYISHVFNRKGKQLFMDIFLIFRSKIIFNCAATLSHSVFFWFFSGFFLVRPWSKHKVILSQLNQTQPTKFNHIKPNQTELNQTKPERFQPNPIKTNLPNQT